jgi:hypothetical protein
VRVETDRSAQAASRSHPLVPGVHQAIQRFAGNRSRNANCPRLIEMGNDAYFKLTPGPACRPRSTLFLSPWPFLSHNRSIITFPTGFSVRQHTERKKPSHGVAAIGITSAGRARRCRARSSRGPRR